jgi:hypothetical protein
MTTAHNAATPSRFAPGALLLCLLMLSGCAMTHPPEVRIIDSRVTERSDEAALVVFTIELANPNPQPLSLSEFRYHLTVDGRRVFDSRRAAQATIRGEGTQEIDLPAVVPFDVLTRVPVGRSEVALGGELKYLAPGALAEILFDAGVRVPSKRFAHSTAVDFSTP